MLKNINKNMNTIRTKIRLAILLSSIVLLTIYYIYSCKNDDIVEISHDSGFYNSNFYLKLNAKKNIKIYYTLDCSKPTQNSTQYTKPILITDFSLNKNIYSARNDMYTEYTSDKIISMPKKKEIIPKFLVDKCAIIRFAYYNNGKYLKEDYRVFFVNFNQKRGYNNIYIISVMTEPENLINGKNGILVLGDAFFSEVHNKKSKINRSLLIHKANFFQKGSKWKKQAYIDIFNRNKHILTSMASIEIKGGMSRKWSQKSIGVELIPSSKNKNSGKFKLYNCGNDVAHKIRDYAIQSLEANAKSNFLTLKMFPCVVFLNGEYWGVYYIMEDYNKPYFYKNYNISKNNIIFFKTSKSIDREEYYAHYDKIKNFFEQKDMRIKENYKKIERIIDIDSFVDYYATEIYIANLDWRFLYWNYALYRLKNNKTQKWKFALFDVNIKYVLTKYKTDTIKQTMENDPIFKALIKNKQVQKKFKKRFKELEKIYSVENFIKLYDRWYAVMKEPLIKNHQRFFNGENFEKDIYDDKMQIIKFLKYRKNYIDKYMELHFD